ncbi:MAG: putative metalloprotease CJM1_0395 family protein [Gammaproteobacteria bacterium]
MISSVSSYSPPAWQSDYAKSQSVASTNSPDQNIKKDPTLKSDTPQSTDNKKNGELSEDDLKIVNELKKIDTDVRAHEAAHLAAAGGIATSGVSFNYQQGPDGIRYAIGGEVSIDTSSVSGDPAATIRKAETIRRAALAPAQPSGADMQAAASATAMAARAQVELLQKNQETQNGNKEQQGTQINVSA